MQRAMRCAMDQRTEMYKKINYVTVITNSYYKSSAFLKF